MPTARSWSSRSLVTYRITGDTSVTVSGAGDGTATVAITAPQKVSTTWGGTFTWSKPGSTMTVKPNGGGNTFGFTTMTNGNTTARPRITSCTPG
jgi:hypothetical protein